MAPERLQVPPPRSKSSGQKALGEAGNAAWNLPALHPNHTWSYDFVSAVTADGRPVRILNVLYEYTRESLGSLVARRIGARQVTRHLAKLFAQHGKPKYLRSDNGREAGSSSTSSTRATTPGGRIGGWAMKTPAAYGKMARARLDEDSCEGAE